LLKYLTGKVFPGQVNANEIGKKSEKIQILYTQYSSMIRYLKENGALLNTIRPEYMLNLFDYKIWIRNNQSLWVGTCKLKDVMLNEAKHTYL